jgi:hypothetical protein
LLGNVLTDSGRRTGTARIEAQSNKKNIEIGKCRRHTTKTLYVRTTLRN